MNRNNENKFVIIECFDLFFVIIFFKICNIFIGYMLVCLVIVVERCIFVMFLSFKGFKEVFKFIYI